MPLAIQIGGGVADMGVLYLWLAIILAFGAWTVWEMGRVFSVTQMHSQRSARLSYHRSREATRLRAKQEAKMNPVPFGLKDVIRGVRETFPLAAFNFQYPTPGKPPRIFIDVGNSNGRENCRIVLQPQEDGKKFDLLVLLNTWGDGSELTHWETKDNITLEVEGTPNDDLVGWLSCLRADIPADKDVALWDEDEVCHLRQTTRMCWMEHPPTERFPVVQIHGTRYKTSNSEWKILFLRPGESQAYILNNQGHPLKHAPEALIREIEYAAEQVLSQSDKSSR